MTVPNTPLVWLITGCSSGFGYELASQALHAGYEVVATSRKPSKTLDLVSAFEQAGGTWLTLDLSDEATVSSAIQQTMDKFGRIDVLVNNAGYAVIGPLESITDNEAKAQMDTNFHAPLRLMQAVLPGMRKQQSGVIVNMSSIAGLDTTIGNLMYAASKHALEAVSQGLAEEVAPFGIKVLIVEPGNFRTTFLDSYAKPARDMSQEYSESPVIAMLAKLREISGKQQGDVEKGCRLILEAVTRTGRFEGQPWLLRLPLGSDCVARATNRLNSIRDNFAELKDISESTDIVE